MSVSFRVASFNVENLFSRAKVLNKEDRTVGTQIMKAIEELDKLLRKQTYTSSIKSRILELYQEEEFDSKKLKYYIKIREDRGKLFQRSGYSITGIKAKGSKSWDGSIEYLKASFNEVVRENTAKVIKAVDADIACIVEAEDRPSLNNFNSSMLDSKKFKYNMLIDGNDRRGIDVALMSNYKIKNIVTHIYDGNSRSRTFSRDCLEITVELPNKEDLVILCNHLKSKGYGDTDTSNKRRKRQAQAIADILGKYKLSKDNVIVAGDLNDTPESDPLSPLMKKRYLYDVLELQYGKDMLKRWTYRFKKFEQIDYILISKPLKEKFIRAGVERRGIYNLSRLTNGEETEFDSVTHWSNAASDHGGVYVDIAL